MQAVSKAELVQQLQKEVLTMQGLRRTLPGVLPDMGLGELASAFPGNTFPTGAVHEFISTAPEAVAATHGFICGLLKSLMQGKGYCVWVGSNRTLFPPALKLFGVESERIVFVDPKSNREVLWAVEEALRCDALSAVVGNLRELSFNESRRLQLAVENSCVTGFIHRYKPRQENTVACVTRWKIKPIPTQAHELPGVGLPGWQVELLRVRNGKPGSWQLQWNGSNFQVLASAGSNAGFHKRKTG